MAHIPLEYLSIIVSSYIRAAGLILVITKNEVDATNISNAIRGFSMSKPDILLNIKDAIHKIQIMPLAPFTTASICTVRMVFSCREAGAANAITRVAVAN